MPSQARCLRNNKSNCKARKQEHLKNEREGSFKDWNVKARHERD